MNDLFSKRCRHHFIQMNKYLRYVLNDHFVLACLFLLGSTTYYYSETLKVLSQDFLLGKICLLIIFTLHSLFGHLATLIKEADKVFLLPKEKKFKKYFHQAINYSLIMPTVGAVLLVGFLMPLMIISMKATWLSFICVCVGLFLWKRVDIIFQFLVFLQEGMTTLRANLFLIIEFIIRLITFYIGVFISPVVMLLLVGIIAIGTEIYLRNLSNNFALKWDLLIDKERMRIHRIYRFFSLFTDVPGVATKVKRRKYFDGLLKKIKPVHKNTFLYLYWRTFLRGTEYSSLVLRLSIIGVLGLIFINQPIVSLLVAALLFYLIGFQLLPIYSSYDYMQMTKLYPVSIKEKQHSLMEIFTVILGLVTCLFILISSITFSEKRYLFLLALLLFIEGIFFIKWYMPKRLKIRS
ncbi:MAG: ABC transporter permease [Streptococcaceae bacterium]|jgi:ABC-2 type transport system permease protein|nr:ABC transporter permease [Streptococcaceae bacterium]